MKIKYIFKVLNMNLIKSIFKKLFIPNKGKILNEDQKELLNSEIKQIQTIINKLTTEYYKYCEESNEKLKQELSTCKCGSTNIVDKIFTEIKTGTNYSKFTFIPNTKYSYSKKSYINHCNDCGNEFDKKSIYESHKYKSQTYHEKFEEDFYDKLKYPNLYKSNLQEYNNFYAESMYDVFKEKTGIKLSQFKIVFKSIYDK